MKKSHTFDKLSDKVCAFPGCKKKLKMRIVEQTNHDLCYEHYALSEEKRNHFIKGKKS